MLGTTSSERTTAAEQLQGALQGQHHVHPNGHDGNYDGTAAAAYTASLTDDANQFHHAHHHSNSYASTAAQAAAELQRRAELQRKQQQLQQQELHQQELHHQQQHQPQHHQHQQHQQQQLQQYHQQAAQAQQQQHQQQLQSHLQTHPGELSAASGNNARYFEQLEYERRDKLQRQQFSYQMNEQREYRDLPIKDEEANLDDYETGGILTSKFNKDEIIRNFTSKPSLVSYVKDVLSLEERCKIVINSSKPKAVYFQCERSGLFRTTVKDSAKRQRVAYTKRSKCGFRLVANLYPLEKDKKRGKRDDDKDDDEESGPINLGAEKWVLRMIEPIHNHPAEPLGSGAKRKKSKNVRTLVEKPLHRNSQGLTSHTANGNAAAAAASALAAEAAGRYVSNDMIDLAQTDPHLSQLHRQQHIALQRQQLGYGEPEAVIAAIETEGSIDPSVQAHDQLRQLNQRR